VFLRLAERHRLYAFFRLAAYTGARRGELLNLRWADVDLDAAKIVIRGSAAVIHGERVEGTTKGGRQRTVRIDPGTVQVLREHRARQAADRLTASSEWAGGDYVFTTGSATRSIRHGFATDDQAAGGVQRAEDGEEARKSAATGSAA
jgi:integrase